MNYIHMKLIRNDYLFLYKQSQLDIRSCPNLNYNLTYFLLF